MTHNIEHIGKAMTAIAAVLAFSSAPLLAQDAAPPDPAIDTSAETPAPADPLAPEPSSADQTVPPAPQPKVEATTRTERATPSARSSPTRSTARRASAAAPAATAAAPEVQSAAPASPPAEFQAPAAAAPAAAAPAAPVPVAEPAAASSARGALASDLMANDTLPIAGAAALGLLALGGAAMAARRRRRRLNDEEFEARQQALAMIDDEPTLELSPADEIRPGAALGRASGPIHDPVPQTSGFDTSQFGRHVQAAYRGPTADNPSVSLEYRLRRAAALDAQEGGLAQQAGQEGAAQSPAKAPARGNWESRPDADFLLRRAERQPRRPAEQDQEKGPD